MKLQNYKVKSRERLKLFCKKKFRYVNERLLNEKIKILMSF